MKIIDECEIFEPKECYFAVLDNPDPTGSTAETMVLITPISYWEENEYLYDQMGDHSFEEDVLPEDFENVTNATWLSGMSLKETQHFMLYAGFIENQDLADV